MIRQLDDNDAEILENFLVNHTESSMFLRGNVALSGMRYKPEPYHGHYLGSFDDAGYINGVLTQYWNGNIMMQAPDAPVLLALIDAFRKQAPRSVAGCLGPADQVETVIQALDLPGDHFAMKGNEGLYALDLDQLIVPESDDAVRHQMILAEHIDEKILARWLKAYEIEALNSEETPELETRIAERVQRTKQGGDCWVLQVDGQPVALSGFNSRLPDIVQIGPVWTPPEHRRQGYARMLVALTLQAAKAQGVKKSVLFTDNPAAAKAYQAIGFNRIGAYCLAILKKPIDIMHGRQP